MAKSSGTQELIKYLAKYEGNMLVATQQYEAAIQTEKGFYMKKLVNRVKEDEKALARLEGILEAHKFTRVPDTRKRSWVSLVHNMRTSYEKALVGLSHLAG